MRRMTRWLTLGVVAITAVPACGDPLGIDDILGIWNTASIGGHTVPGNVVYEGVEYDTEYVRWAFYDGGLCTLTQRVDGLTTTYDECSYTMNAEQEAIAKAVERLGG